MAESITAEEQPPASKKVKTKKAKIVQKKKKAPVVAAPAVDAEDDNGLADNPFIFDPKTIVKAPDSDEENEDASTDPEDAEAGTSKRKRTRKRKSAEGGKPEPVVQSAVQHGDNAETTAYLAGIPFDASPDDVRRFFCSNGVLDQDILNLRLPTWNDSGRLRGYGHVVFSSEECLDAAILNCNKKYMGKRYVEVTKANSRNDPKSLHRRPETTGPPPPDCRTIFCHNLSYTTTEEEIAKVFSQFGKVMDVRIARHSGTRNPKGFGYVTMESPSSVTAAVQGQATSPVSLEGRTLRLDYDTGVAKGSFRTSTGELWSKKHR